MGSQKFDFASDELDGLDTEDEAVQGSQASEQAVAQTVESLYAPPQEAEAQDDVDAEMAAVEERLAIAQYYRLLLNDTLFNDASAAASQVEKEVRAFVRSRLEVLMGVKPEKKAAPVPVQLPFSTAQLEVLKKVADKVLDAEARGGFKPTQPVAPVQAPPPTLNKVTPPQPSVRQQATVPAPKPQAQPARVPAAKPGLKKTFPARGAQQQAPAPVVDDSRIPAQYKDDPTITIKNGKVFVQQRNGDGEPLFVMDPSTKKSEPLLKDVTLPARPAPGSAIQPVPVLGIHQTNTLALEQAGSAMQSAENRATAQGVGNIFGGAVTNSLISRQAQGEQEDEQPF